MNQSFNPGRALRAQVFLPALVSAALLSGCGGNGAAPLSSVPEGGPGVLPAQRIEQSEASAGPRASVTTYDMRTLATLGGKGDYASAINRRSQITGASLLKGDTVEHAALWRAYRATDLGTLGGPNSDVQEYNHGTRGQFVGLSEVSQIDPYAENYCNFGTSHICLGFSWQNGKMTSLPTLGGNNSGANDVNNLGQIVGEAETSTRDSSCPAPLVFDSHGVIWNPNGKIVTLAPLSGDTFSNAFSINQSGAAVGWSGTCAVTAHAVLWQTGSMVNLGSLGGSYNNAAVDINNRGQIVGYSDVSGDTAIHAFLWQSGTMSWQSGTMSDLGTLPGDTFSVAAGINDKGQVVGESCNASSCRGFIWQNGSMTDLNLLVPPSRNLYVLYGGDINSSGKIVGAALNPKGLERAVVLIPGKKAADLPTGVSAPKFAAQQSLRIQLRNGRVAPTALRKSIFSL
jgi:probable HAF family extracellular repeat protein